MWKQFKNIILDQRIAQKHLHIQHAKLFISNSTSFNQIQTIDDNTISRFSYVKKKALKSINPILIIGKTFPIPNSFTLFEYTALYPQLLGLYHTENPMDIQQAKIQIEKKGINIEKNDPHQIGGIYIIGLDKYWDIQAQVVCDLLSTENGLINNKFDQVQKHIPLEYFYNKNDKDMEKQRIVIESTYQLIYQQDIKSGQIISDFDILKDYANQINDKLLFINEEAQFIISNESIIQI